MRTLLACLLMLWSTSIWSADWATWRGPSYNGVSAETELDFRWDDAGPRVLWRADVAISASGVTIAEDRVYAISTVGKRNKQAERTVWCFAADTGRVIWKHTGLERAGFSAYDVGPGAAATPIIDDGRVYIFGRQSETLCLDAATGTVVWERPELIGEFGLQQGHTGTEGTPLILGDVLLVNAAGPYGVGLDKRSGAVRWVSDAAGRTIKELGASHVSPVPFPHAGPTAALFLAGDGLRTIDVDTGKETGFYAFPAHHSHHIPSPVVLDDQIFVHKGSHLRLLVGDSTGALTERYQKKAAKELAIDYSCLVPHDGFLYGDGSCIELATGTVRYRHIFPKPNRSSGGVILADGHLIILTGGGVLVIAEPNPEAFTPVAEARVFTPQTDPKNKEIRVVTAPSLAHRRLYLRSTRELVCIDLSKH